MTGADPLLHRLGGGGGSSGGYVIDGSMQFKAASGQYLAKTFGGAGTDSTRAVIHIEFQRTAFGTYQRLFSVGPGSGADSSQFEVYFHTDNTLVIGTWSATRLKTNRVFRDPVAFGSITVLLNTNDAAAYNRLRLFVDDEEVTSFSTRNNFGSGDTTALGGAVAHYICRQSNAAQGYVDGYMSRFVYLDGQTAADASAFVERDANGCLVPVKISGLTFGTNGFWFEGSTFGADRSGNGNNFTAVNSPTITNNSPTNDPANDVGLLCVMNAVGGLYNSGLNIKGAGTIVDNYASQSVSKDIGTLFVNAGSGRWYYEVLVGSYTADGGCAAHFGVATQGEVNNCEYTFTNQNDAGEVHDNGNTAIPYATGVSANSSGGDRFGFLLDMDAGTISISKNGTWFFNDHGLSARTKAWAPWCHLDGPGSDRRATLTFNFGQSPFTYTPPTGAKPWCLAHFDEPDCADPDTEYLATTFAHTGGATTNITLPWNTDVFPTMVRVRQYNGGDSWHVFDTVRGNNKRIKWNSTDIEDTMTSGGLFSETTFTLGTQFGTGNYLLEAFKADRYFQIKTYTGTGSAHTESFPGMLAAAPGFLATMYLGGGNGHLAYHSSLGATKSVNVLDNGGAGVSPTYWNDTAPTTSGFAVGTANGTNQNGIAYVAYAWANAGPYWFGNELFNGSADGQVAYTGGRPKTVVSRGTDTATHWVIHSDVLNPSGNPHNNYMMTNKTDALASDLHTDFLATGRKFRTSWISGASASSAFGIRALRGPGTAQARAV